MKNKKKSTTKSNKHPQRKRLDFWMPAVLAGALVFSSRYLSWFPNLSHLIEKRDLPPGLSLVYQSDQPAGIRTVVYRVGVPDSLSAKKDGVR